MRNLEIKLELTRADFHRLRDVVIGMPDAATLRQIDTYFVVTSGRLKLRQITAATGDAAELIAYHRPDASGARWSSYERLDLTPAAARLLRSQLAGTAGIAVVVEKERLVALRQHTRIHVDQVTGLGQFLELETVADDLSTADDMNQELTATLEWLGIATTTATPVAGSYADLMRRATTATTGA